jgi:PAS domain S-box-containing protein
MGGEEFASFEAVPDAVLIVNRNRSIVSANVHAERLFGYEEGSLIGLTIEALIPERFRAQHARLVEEFFAHPSARPMGTGRELLALKGDGQEFPVEIAIGDSKGGKYTVAVIRDITATVRSREELETTLNRLRLQQEQIELLKNRLAAESEYLQEEIKTSHNFEEIIGNSTAMMATLYKVERVAETDASVLLLGETGTGKELLARAIHSRSKRKTRPLIKVDCTTLPPGLIESELFGHEKGAFTGAHAPKPGRFEVADGGTLFLDEVGELPLELQGKLLRVIQEGEFQRLGGRQAKKVDVRIIAATNRELHSEIREGRFRSDLYYRLSVFPIEIPPLRDRRDDIPLLTTFFISQRSRALGKKVESVTKATMDALMAYDWPGNIRELQNVTEHALILSPGRDLVLPEKLGNARALARAPGGALRQDLKGIERKQILKALEQSDWKIKGEGNAASRLGLKPSTLRSRMKKLGIERPS